MTGILRKRIETGNFDHLDTAPQDNPEPDLETLEHWMNDSGCEATDGCWVEPDGHCEHGKPSWLLKMGLI